MDDLRFVGLSEDGTHLVLEETDGNRHGLRLDERLYAAFRGDRARLGQLQIEIQGELRPREIQARIRAGQTAAEIAAAAGVSIDRVSRYEAPILLERVHVAEQAQRVGVRRVTDSTSTPLGDLVRQRLGERGVDDGSLDWDSWRRDDGRWLVRLAYRAGDSERAATWLFDLQRRSLEPADDEARWLTDEERAAPAPPRPGPVRLTAVPAAQADEEAGRHDTVPVRRAPEARAERLDDPVELDPPVADEPVGPLLVEVVDGGAADAAAPAADDSGTAADDEPARPAPRPAAKRRNGRRATVPSWDEILFGAPRPDPDRRGTD
jgi:hypothetical protein